jgi:hypothetical protein
MREEEKMNWRKGELVFGIKRGILGYFWIRM